MRLIRERTVKDYLDLLDEGTGLLLVGGQAVNLWAEKYREKDPVILEFEPFTSRDADFYRRVPRLKLPPNWTKVPIPTKGRMRLVTHALRGPEGQDAEILRSVNGLTDEDIHDQAMPIQYAGKLMWFLTPIALFQAKLANLDSIPQEGRQDLKHLRLLVPVSRCFIEEVLAHTTEEARPQRIIKWLTQHKQNLRSAMTKGHLNAGDLEDSLPIDAMKAHPSESVRNFLKHLDR